MQPPTQKLAFSRLTGDEGGGRMSLYDEKIKE
jgi:hypothetical protein